jgi:tetratricopeptide (TPR) repeat protein
MNNLESMYFRQKRYAEALPLAEEVYEQRRRQLGADHPRTLNAQHNLGMAQGGSQQLERAAATLRSAFEARRRVLGASHPLTLGTGTAYADALNQLGERDAALREYEQLFAAAQDATDPALRDLKTRIVKAAVDLNMALGKRAAADRWGEMLRRLESADSPVAPGR